MPAPRKVISLSALALRAASSAMRSYTAASGMPSGSSSGRSRRTLAGMSANRSSIERAPIVASICSRSRSVADV